MIIRIGLSGGHLIRPIEDVHVNYMVYPRVRCVAFLAHLVFIGRLGHAQGKVIQFFFLRNYTNTDQIKKETVSEEEKIKKKKKKMRNRIDRQELVDSLTPTDSDFSICDDDICSKIERIKIPFRPTIIL